MVIRPATRNDIEAIREIYNDAVLTTTATYDYEPRSVEKQIAWYDDHEKNDYPVFVAEEGGRVIGWSCLNVYRDRPGYRYTTENSIYVAPDARGRGVGKALMPPLIEAAKARKLHAILAGIDGTNEVSVRLHAAFGFEKVALFKQVGFKFGRWLDVIYMEKIL